MISKDAPHHKACTLTRVSDLVSQAGSPLAIGKVCSPPWGGNSLHKSIQSLDRSQGQVRHNFSLDLGKLFLAVSPRWAGGQLHSGIPGWRRSYQVCSDSEQHIDTYSSRTYGTCMIHLSSHGLSQKGGLLG